MKRLLTAVGFMFACLAQAQVQWISADIENKQLGTGVPAKRITVGEDTAFLIKDGMYHIPQYMAHFPTAATLWVRVVEVECDEDTTNNTLKCDGYHWSPSQGRGEYLLFTPKMRQAPPKPVEPVCCTVPQPIVKIIEIEVPHKKKNQ